MNQIMEEKAIWFFVLLEEAYKIKAEEMSELGNISLLPYMSDRDRRSFIGDLKRIRRDTIDIGENDDYSGLQELKREFKK